MLRIRWKGSDMNKQDTIEQQITVSSPIDRVWRALTVAEEVAAWFGDHAEIDLRPGGTMKVGWSEYETTVNCVVETVEPPSVFSYRWKVEQSTEIEAWTLVTFTLAEVDGMTTVTVVEAGLADVPEALYSQTIEENTSGWKAEMADLQTYLETT